jgi:hypothetical protein
MSQSNQKLQIAEQKTVTFYNDQITAVRVKDGRIFVPIRPICESLGLAWNAQFERIGRDPVLSTEVQGIRVTRTPEKGGSQEMSCLHLDFLNGWLFGVNANRVKPEIKERLITYQRECYRVLYEATQDGRLTTGSDVDIEALLEEDSESAQAYKIALAVVKLARNQLLLDAQVQEHDATLAEHNERLDLLETAVGGKHVTEAQASQISQAVKAVALALGKQTKRNEFGAVYGELYRKFSVSSYKAIPQKKFGAVMEFLNEWLQSLISDSPF